MGVICEYHRIMIVTLHSQKDFADVIKVDLELTLREVISGDLSYSQTFKSGTKGQ